MLQCLEFQHVRIRHNSMRRACACQVDAGSLHRTKQYMHLLLPPHFMALRSSASR
jgi:hypothetical protein